MTKPASSPTVSQGLCDKFRSLLADMFQMDKGDLDFGIYKVLAKKRELIDKFLDKELSELVTNNIGELNEENTKTLKNELSELIFTLENAGVRPNTVPKVSELKEKIRNLDSDKLSIDVFNHLIEFFSRYYDSGDFVPQRKFMSAGKEVYSIPYNGEEVMLYWANSDQYYVKTAENYNSYQFTVGKDHIVKFAITCSETVQDQNVHGNKENKKFILASSPVSEVGGGGVSYSIRSSPLDQ